MRPKTFALIVTMTCLRAVGALSQSEQFQDSVATYFQEIREATAQNKGLWGLDLYGPILLVDVSTRMAYANVSDSGRVLLREGAIYQGMLPKSINVSNTSLTWGGRSWAMVMLPLPAQKENRLNLLGHELFHRAQKALNFVAFNPANDHLDRKEGRISLRLELEALKQALRANTREALRSHIEHALTFRAYRYSLFPGADSTENLLELNEGITEYTGVKLSGRSHSRLVQHLIHDIDNFMADPSYVRSFAYQTIPVYGFLLEAIDSPWVRKVTSTTDLFRFLQQEFKIQVQIRVQTLPEFSAQYAGDRIIHEEEQRAAKLEQLVSDYVKRFVTDPHLEIPLEHMNMSFEYKNITPLGEYGTVYPVIRITDDWGVLEVRDGALMSSQWNKVSVSAPSETKGRKSTGSGWTLELNEPYTVTRDAESGNYRVNKK